MIKKLLLCSLLFFTFYSTFAQKKKEIDNIYKIIGKSYVEGNTDKNAFLKTITDLYYFSRESGNVEAQIYSNFEYSRISYLNGNYNESLFKINEGISLAKLKKDYNMLCRLILVYQQVLLQLNHLKESEEILKKCEEYNHLLSYNDDKIINNVYILLAKADLLKENGLNRGPSILTLKKNAYTEAKKISETNTLRKATLLYTLESLAWSTTLSGNFSESKKYVAIIDQLLINYPDENFIIKNLEIKAIIKNLENEHDAAIDYFNQAISIAQNNNNAYKLHEIYPLISSSYSELKDFENALKYSLKYKKLTDSMNFVKKISGEASLINGINLKILNKQNKTHNFPIYIIVVNILIICGLLFVIFFKKKAIINIFSPQHKPQVSEKKFQQNNPLEISEINIASTNNNSDEKVIEKNDENVNENQSEISKNLIYLAKEDIDVFYVEFQNIYPTFYQKLKEQYPDLNPADLHLCSLIKMNFSIKQISIYTKSSVRSVEGRRYRVTKKMGIASQSELYFIISQIK